MIANHIPQLIEAMERGNLVLFIGADLPQEATSLPCRAELATRLAQRLGIESAPPAWPAAAAQYEASAGLNGLIRWLREQVELAGRRPGPIYPLLAQLPAATYITTACDTGLYQALRDAGRQPNLPVVDASSLGLLDAGRPTVVHLFGICDRPESLVLTAAQMQQLAQSKAQILAGLVHPTLAHKTVLIVGQDLRDPYFQAIYQNALFQAGTIRPPAYAAWQGLKDWEKQTWLRQQVRIIEMPAMEIVNGLTQDIKAPPKAALSTPPNVEIVRDSADGYYLLKEGTRYPLRQEMTLRDIGMEHGFNRDDVRDMTDDGLSQFKPGETITNTTPWIARSPTGTPYLIRKNSKREIPDARTLTALAGDVSPRVLTKEELACFQSYSDIPDYYGAEAAEASPRLVAGKEWTYQYLQLGRIRRHIPHGVKQQVAETVGEPVEEQSEQDLEKELLEGAPVATAEWLVNLWLERAQIKRTEVVQANGPPAQVLGTAAQASTRSSTLAVGYCFAGLLLLDLVLIVVVGWPFLRDQPALLSYLEVIVGILGLGVALLLPTIAIRQQMSVTDILHLLGKKRWLQGSIAFITAALFGMLSWSLATAGPHRPTTPNPTDGLPTVTSSVASPGPLALIKQQPLVIGLARFQSDAELTSTASGIQTEVRNTLEARLYRDGIGQLVAISDIDRIPSDTNDAISAGKEISASLVIWGSVMEGHEGELKVFVRFIETADLIHAANYPSVIPISHLDEPPSKSVDITISSQDYRTQELTTELAPLVSFSTGLIQYYLGDFRAAKGAFLGAAGEIDLEQKDTDHLANTALVEYYLGKSYQMLREWEEALKHLELAARTTPDEPAAHLALAAVYYGWNGDAQSADAEIETVIRLCTSKIGQSDPLHRAAYYYDLGLAYELQSGWAGTESLSKSVQNYENAIAEEPKLYMAYLGLARVYVQNENYVQAASTLEQALKIGETAYAYIALGRIRELQKMDKDAEDTYRQATACQAPEAFYYLGRLYEKQGRYDQAIEQYKLLLPLVKENKAWVHADLGHAYFESKQFDKAVEEYERAVVLEDGDGKARFRAELGRALSAAGRQEEAFQELSQALEEDPDMADAHFTLGQIQELRGEKEEACKAYQSCIEKAGDDSALIDDAQHALDALCAK